MSTDPNADKTLRAGSIVLALGFVMHVLSASPVNADDALGALFGGVVCGGPFYVVAFILSIVAMTRGRVGGGIGLLVATMAAPIVAAALDIVITHG